MTPKTNIATTSSQSRRLLECGVDPKTADMVWTRFESDGEQYERLDVMSEDAYEVSSLKPAPAWSLSALLALIPQTIYAPDITDVPDNVALDEIDSCDWVAPLCEFQWQMWCNPESSFEFEGEKTVNPPVYGMKYTSVRFLPPTHPIAPNSPLTLYLYDEDGNRVAWTDENPVEVCVQAIEWLTANNYKLNHTQSK